MCFEISKAVVPKLWVCGVGVEEGLKFQSPGNTAGTPIKSVAEVKTGHQ